MGVWGKAMTHKEYPIQTQVGTFTNDAELDAFLAEREESAILAYDYSLIGYSTYIYTPQITEYITRYKMQKNHGLHSYGTDFDRVPAVWIDVLGLIDSEVERAMDEKRKQRQ